MENLSFVFRSDVVSRLYLLRDIDLKQFCSKSFYQIIMISESTLTAQDLLYKIIEHGKQMEYFSQINFITYSDVIDFVIRLEEDPFSVDLPDELISNLDVISETVGCYLVGNAKIHYSLLAALYKLKIIEHMYRLYIQAVNTGNRQKELQKELAELTKYDPKVKPKPPEKKLVVQKPVPKIPDYTKLPIEQSQIVFDYNLDANVQFYVLVGFQDKRIINSLLELHVPICSIIDFTDNHPDKNQMRYKLNGEIHELFDLHLKYLEEIAFLKYQGRYGRKLQQLFEELSFVIKRITYIKRTHLNYLQRLKIVPLGPNIRHLNVACFNMYNHILQKYPHELINIELIMDAIIEEVCWNLADIRTKSSSEITESPPESLHDDKMCTIPFGVKTIFKYNPIESKDNKNNIAQQSYLVHSHDNLFSILQCYKHIGKHVYDKTLLYMKKVYPILTLNEMEGKFLSKEYNEKIAVTKVSDFIHLALFDGIPPINLVPPLEEKVEFAKFINAYCPFRNFYNKKYKIMGRTSDYQPPVEAVFIEYLWTEDISEAVMLQLLSKYMKDYQFCQTEFSEETDCLLIKFHNNLDENSICTITWDEYLDTPICLRDFCKYITSAKKEWFNNFKLREHDDLPKKLDINDPPTVTLESKKKELYDLYLAELQSYDGKLDLVPFCNFFIQYGYIRCYDLVPPERVKITGVCTIFGTFDDCRIIVDNCKFLHESNRCTVKIQFEENTIIFHTLNPQKYHLVLFDETLIVFDKYNKKIMAEEGIQNEEEEGMAEEMKFILPKPQKGKPAAAAKKEKVEEEEGHRVPIMTRSRLLLKYDDNDNTDFLPRTAQPYTKICPINEKTLGTILELFRTVIQKEPKVVKIYSKNNKELKRKFSENDMPLYALVSRYLFKQKIRRNRIYKNFGIRSFYPMKKFPNKIVIPIQIFHINLPNGLYVSNLDNDNEIIEIRQEYKYRSGFKEKYRIFYNNGDILIKYHNGIMHIYRSNGDIIEFCDAEEEALVYNRLKAIRRILQSFFKDNSDCYPSRNPENTGKVTLPEMLEFGDVPYSKRTLIKADGWKYDDCNGKITKNQQYFYEYDEDYGKQELLMKRNDGLCYYLQRDGNKIVQFPDGTKIHSYFRESDELIQMDDNEPWVFLTMAYEIEHPEYVTIEYQNYDQSTNLYFANGTKLYHKNKTFKMLLKNTTINMDCDNIKLSKICTRCDGTFNCNLNINPSPDKPILITAKDSYGKTFKSDYLGNCTIGGEFARGPINRLSCNHYKIYDQEKLIILSKQLNGSILHRDTFVRNKLEYPEINEKIYKYSNKCIKRNMIEIFKEHYKQFSKRHTKIPKHEQTVVLTRDKSNFVLTIYYVTYNILREIFNFQKNKEILEEILYYYRTTNSLSKFLMNKLERIIAKIYIHKDESFTLPEQKYKPIVYKQPHPPYMVYDLIAKYTEERNFYWNGIVKKKFPRNYWGSLVCKDIMFKLQTEVDRKEIEAKNRNVNK